jgi:hypothetical protein
VTIVDPVRREQLLEAGYYILPDVVPADILASWHHSGFHVYCSGTVDRDNEPARKRGLRLSALYSGKLACIK